MIPARSVLPSTILAVVLCALGLAACQEPPGPSSSKPSDTSPAAGKSETKGDTSKPANTAPISAGNLDALTVPAPKRVVAIGDVHGDLSATKRALRLAGAIDEADHWIGGELVVVQTGDQLDRGDDDRAILDQLEAWSEQAKAAGGALVALNGNHETMNVALDFRYVTKGSLAPFDEFASGPDAPPAGIPDDMLGRARAFRPGGPYARKMAKRHFVAIAGSSVFVHGGLHPEHVRYGLSRLDDEVTAWMRGDKPPPPAILSDDSPVWSRRYGERPDVAACRSLAQVLEALGVKRMVIGHTVHKEGITSACGDMVWRIDVGLAAHYGGPMQVLQIEGDAVQILGK